MTTTSPSSPQCWICGRDPGNSREHRTKKSDLKAVFGKVTQANPVHYRDDQRRQRRICSLDADLTKFPDKICQHCNGARTQPHDRAWETLSMALRTRRPKLSLGMYVRTDRHGILPYNTARYMVRHASLLREALWLLHLGRT